MQKIVYTILIMLNGMFVFSQYFSPEKYPVYNGSDLGLTYSKTSSLFKIWSPTAEKVSLLFYHSSVGGSPFQIIEMEKSLQGTWTKSMAKDLKGVYYVFKIFTHGKWMNEVPDPYAKAVGTNGKRAVVVDLKETNPVGWDLDKSPSFSTRKNLAANIGGLPTDAVIYEMHLRDFTIDKQSGMQARGKYGALTEVATMNIAGVQTGLDHLQEMGITHVHLLPVYDFYSIDGSKKDSNQYNWGYDPLNYNTPEGSYSSNPDDGLTRIKELGPAFQAAGQPRGERLVVELLEAGQLVEIPEGRQVERPVDPVDLAVAVARAVVQVLGVDDHAGEPLVRLGGDLEADRLAPLPGLEPVLDEPQHVVGQIGRAHV